mmetsp:Transcript_10497/g.23112  ORF Transcript_10497/g.23112 Transcript_10497/m.23112 type:complete len:277 (+) Transcript_10497:51-881(+)
MPFCLPRVEGFPCHVEPHAGDAPASPEGGGGGRPVEEPSSVQRRPQARVPTVGSASDDQEKAQRFELLKQSVERLAFGGNGEGEGADGTVCEVRAGCFRGLLRHLECLYNLLEGISAAFVWKYKKKKQGEAAKAENRSWAADAMSFAAAFLQTGTKTCGGQASEKAKNSPGEGQMLLSRCMLALSTDLSRLEVHHSHEVSMVCLSHVVKVFEGGTVIPISEGGTGEVVLDEWCAVLHLEDGHEMALRFFRRKQAEAFVSIIECLSTLARAGLPLFS